MSLLLALALFGSMPTDERTGVVTDEVDKVELNHYYDDDGRHVFDQLIFYERSETGFQVRTWRLVKSESMHPSSGTMIWHDGEVMRRVNYRVRIESWTQHDPEMTARGALPREYRRGLLTPQRNEPSESDLIP